MSSMDEAKNTARSQALEDIVRGVMGGLRRGTNRRQTASESQRGREREQESRNPDNWRRQGAGKPETDEVLDELRAQFAALADAMPAPTLDQFVNLSAYDEAERQARDSHAKAVPVLASTMEDLKKALVGSQKDLERTSAVATSEAQAQDAVVAQDAAQLVALAAQDLDLQSGGDAVGSLVNDNAFQAQAQSQAAQANNASNRQLLADMRRSEQGSINDRQATADIVNAAASADARNNLDSILNEIGMGRAEAKAQGQAQFTDAQSAFGQQQAELGFQQWEAEQALMGQRAEEEAQFAQQTQEMELGRRQATNAMAQAVQNQALEFAGEDADIATVQQFANQIIQQNATGWMNGDTDDGIALDPMEIRASVEAFLKSLVAPA